MVGIDRTLRLGVGKDKEGGRVYMDNMTLTYMGNPQEKSLRLSALMLMVTMMLWIRIHTARTDMYSISAASL